MKTRKAGGLEKRASAARRIARASQSTPPVLIDIPNLCPPWEHLAFPIGDPGSNDSRKWENTESDLDALQADFEAKAAESAAVPVLYNHDEQGPSAGWITGWRRAAEGLYVTIQLTEPAQESLDKREWLYMSPHTFGAEDVAGKWHPSSPFEISLVHTPAQKLGQLKAANAQGGTQMDELIAQIRSLLGLPPEASAEDVLKADIADRTAKAQSEEAAKAKPDEAAAAAPPAVAFPASAAASAQITKIVNEAVESRLAARDDLTAVNEAISRALTAGKAVPDVAQERMRKAGLELTQAWLSTIQPGQTPAEGVVTKRASAGELPKTSSDHLRGHLHAYNPSRAAAYEAAIEYQKKAAANGQQIDFRTAHLAVTRRAA